MVSSSLYGALFGLCFFPGLVCGRGSLLQVHTHLQHMATILRTVAATSGRTLFLYTHILLKLGLSDYLSLLFLHLQHDHTIFSYSSSYFLLSGPSQLLSTTLTKPDVHSPPSIISLVDGFYCRIFYSCNFYNQM